MDNNNIPVTTEQDALAALFTERAQAVAAEVIRVKDGEAAADLVARMRVECGDGAVGTVSAARGIAETGTCVVETDDEETRLDTMIPETSVIILNIRDIVPGLADIAPYLRKRLEDGKISYTSFITGPSRTADIERIGAIGVHGPLRIRIILTEN